MTTKTTNDYTPRPIDTGLIRMVASWPAPERPKEIRDKASGMILRHQPSGYLGLYVELGRGKRETVCDARAIIDQQHPMTMTIARKKAKSLLGRDVDGVDFKSERSAARAVPTFAGFIEDTYGPWFIENRRSGDENIARIKTCFFESFGKLKLDQITPASMDRWKSGALKATRPETVNRDLTRIRAALNQARRWRIISENPIAGFEPARVDRGRRALRAFTEAEQQALRAALAARDARIAGERASANTWRNGRSYTPLPSLDGQYVDCLHPAVIVSLETGLRRGELFALTWERVDLEHCSLSVAGPTAKSFETREIPLSATALATLRRWKLQQRRPEKGLVFPGAKGKLGSLKKSFYAVIKDAEIERVTEKDRLSWHSLRHTFGTRLGAKGIDVETMRSLLGHADIKTTSRYLHTEAARKRAAIEALA